MHIIRTANEKKYYSTAGLAWVVLRSTLGLLQSVLRSKAEWIIVGKPHPMNSIAGLVGKLVHRPWLVIDYDDYEAASTHFRSILQRQIIAFFEDRMARLADFVTTNTYFSRDRLKHLGVDGNKIIYLSNGIDPMWLKPVDQDRVRQIRKDLDLEGKRVVAFIGSLSTPNHPVDLLVEAFNMARKSIPGLTLLLVGGGNAYQRLQSLVREMDLADAVRFTGRVKPDQVPLYYQIADVCVDPVMDDDAARGRQPLKLFESWVSGIPFITGDVGDRKQLSGDPPAVYLCRPSESRALAEAIIRVLCDEELRTQLRSQGLMRIHQYIWPDLARKLAVDLNLQS